jgi:polysaccharide pyruvyl transferase WcaK-like protein
MRPVSHFSIKTQFENVGDALIIRELLKLASRHSDLSIDMSRCPARFYDTIEIDRLGNRDDIIHNGAINLFWSVLKCRLAGKVSYYFFIPGGLHGDFRMEAFIKGILSNIYVTLLFLMGVRLCQVGISYERIGPKHAFLLRWRSKMLHRLLVRDDASFQYAKTFGIVPNGLIPDLSFNMFDEVPQVGGIRNSVAFSFRTDKNAKDKDSIRRLVGTVASLTPPEITLKFIVQVERDLEFMKELKENVATSHTCTLDIHYDSIGKCQEIYRACSQIYSNRLHALLLAMSVGVTPSACINRDTDVKISGLFNDVGLSKHVLHLESWTSEDLQRVSEALEFNAETQTNALRAVMGEIFGDVA